MKSLIRKHFLQLRDNLPVELRDKMSQDICKYLNYKGIIAGYVAFGSEVNIQSIAIDCLPKIIDGEMQFCKAGELELHPRYKFYQPQNNEVVIPDIILVPLVAFDSSNTRLGYGGGFYDRYFAKHPHILKVGVAFSIQKAKHLEREAHDIPLDIIITETTPLL